MPKARLTQRLIDGLIAGPQDCIYWDTNPRGFGCKVTPAGKKVFIVQYRFATDTDRLVLLPPLPRWPHGGLSRSCDCSLGEFHAAPFWEDSGKIWACRPPGRTPRLTASGKEAFRGRNRLKRRPGQEHKPRDMNGAKVKTCPILSLRRASEPLLP